MNYTRPLLLAVSALALLISACSQTADIQAPTLEAQFGTTRSDYGNHVAANTEGIYVGGEWNAKPSLVKFTRAGRLPWLKSLPLKSGGESVNIWDLALTPSGHAFVLYASTEWRSGGPDEGSLEFDTYYLRNYAPEGKLVWDRKLTNASDSTRAVSLGTDKANNLYVAFSGADAGLRKYSASGALVWRKQVPGIIADMAVSPDGFVFAAAQDDGVDKLTRYRSNGTVLWSKTVPFITTEVALGRDAEVYVAGVNYLRPEDWKVSAQLAAYNVRGGKRWQRTVRGDNGEAARPWTLSADAQGNAYIGANTFEVDTNDSISFVQRYSADGRKAWAYQLVISSPYSVAIADVSAVSPSEVYVVGSTTTKVNGVNNGGFDGFVVRLDGRGKKVWSR